MLINVLNGSLKKVAILSNELPNAPSYYNDEFHDYLEQGATTFSFTVAKVINNQLQDYTQFLSDQSYFSFRKNGRDYLMTPSSEQSVHETSTEISFFCVSLDRELINEQANSLTNTASHNIQWYFDQMGLISRTQITIGINEVSNLTRVINYDAQEPKLSRLISVINNFNAEFDFVTTLNNDGSLGTVVLNIYKENDGQNIQGVGTKRDDVRLTFGKNIEDVEVDVSDDGFFNAAYMTGADGFSWKNYDFSYKNSDGVEEFYKRSGSEIAYAPLSAKMFPSQLKTDKGDIWTNSDRTTEYKNANDMWGYIVSQFKQYAYKQITYTVTPSSTLVNQLVGDGRPLQKGDTVIIQDDNYMDIDGNVGLILSARVSEIITSDTNPANNKIVFSNYKKLKSEASSDIKAIVSQLVNDATPYFADIATSNGVQFKNGTGSTTLSAHIFKGSATTETIADSYEWSKDGTVVANVQTITVDASGVADKAVYSFKATVGGKVVAGQSVTITNVNDGKGGADGKTSYTHVAWANSADGTDGFTTVYPNLNLLTNSRLQSGNITPFAPVNNAVLTINSNVKGLNVSCSGGAISYQQGVGQGVIPVSAGNQYTISVKVINTGTVAIDKFILQFGFYNSAGTGLGYPNKTFSIPADGKVYSLSYTATTTADTTGIRYYCLDTATLANVAHTFTIYDMKAEQGSTATPYMPSSSEVTTADWPSYIGQYSDFTTTASTDPAKYAPWTVFKGNDGNNGRGIVSSEQKYQLTQTSAKPVDPWDNSVWQTTQPTTTSTNKYLWSITRTTFNLAPLTQDVVEQKAVYGNKGQDGNPGKIVSDTEPTTRFKGLTWKYSGTADLTASDGTAILSGTEYYWSGTKWILNEINSHNINGDNLNVTNGTFTNGKIKSTWDSGTASGSTEIENSHINMSATDSTSKATNSLGLDVQQGLGMRWSDPTSNQSRSVLLDYGNLSFDRNGVAAGLSFDGTNLSSSMPIQAPNTIVKSTQFSVSGIGIRLDRMMSFVAVTFSGQASSTINNSPTIINVLPDGFRPISPYSIDYMVPGNTANNGYIYFNPDGSIRIMATINSGYYIRGTRFYITNDVYPS